MGRRVKGVFFVDYVRMLKACKDIDWSERFDPDDMSYLQTRVDLDAWYPMDSFERFGLAILDVIAGGNPETARMWGQASVDTLIAKHEQLLVPDNPRESLMRFQVLRGSFFDFDAVTMRELFDTQARIAINYAMRPAAEEAASMQTMGFFERLVELAGGKDVQATFLQCRWQEQPSSLLQLLWH